MATESTVITTSAPTAPMRTKDLGTAKQYDAIEAGRKGRARAVRATHRECFMAMIAAMKNVLSPSSVAKIMPTELTKPLQNPVAATTGTLAPNTRPDPISGCATVAGAVAASDSEPR